MRHNGDFDKLLVGVRRVIQCGDLLSKGMQSQPESWKGPEQEGVLSLIKLHQFPGNLTYELE